MKQLVPKPGTKLRLIGQYKRESGSKCLMWQRQGTAFPLIWYHNIQYALNSV